MPHVIFYFFTLQILTWENSEPHQWKKNLSVSKHFLMNTIMFVIAKYSLVPPGCYVGGPQKVQINELPFWCPPLQ